MCSAYDLKITSNCSYIAIKKVFKNLASSLISYLHKELILRLEVKFYNILLVTIQTSDFKISGS